MNTEGLTTSYRQQGSHGFMNALREQPEQIALITNRKLENSYLKVKNPMKTVEQLMLDLKNYQSLSSIINFNQLQSQSTSIIKRYRESLYFGEFEAGARHGLGIMLYTNGRVFEGEWNANYKHGKGYELFSNGAIYEGTYVNGKPEGYGRYSWDNGETYEGEWVDGTKNGSGIWRGSKGDSYIGEWKNNKADGYGVYTWVNGDRYEGEFVNCLKHGEGVQKFTNGDTYKGIYQNGRPSGNGEYHWENGSYFKGEFKDGCRHGLGLWKRGPGNTDKYEGEYINDQKQGQGVFLWENGDMYKGSFFNDMRHGYGEMVWADGKIYKGEWENGTQKGPCTYQKCAFPQEDVQVRLSRNSKREKILRSDDEDFFEERPFIYHEPRHPSVSQMQNKFRSRIGISSKKSSRQGSEAQKTSRSLLNYYSSNHIPNNTKIKIRTQAKMHKKSSSSTHRNSAAYSKFVPGKNTEANMSSSFFLYKIPNQGKEIKAEGERMVKTSGGRRQKNMSQEMMYFTNKIKPDFL